MAQSEAADQPATIPLLSYQTALCIIPPPHLWQDVNRLRSLYDQAYGKWPPHINLVYPFVPTDRLPDAIQLIQQKLSDFKQTVYLHSGNAGFFRTRQDNTIHLTLENDAGKQGLIRLRSLVLEALGGDGSESRDYQPHLTVGQTKIEASHRDSLLNKANILPGIEWDLNQLVVLVREKNLSGGANEMKVWDTIALSGSNTAGDENIEQQLSLQTLQMAIECRAAHQISCLQPMPAYEFRPEEGVWVTDLRPTDRTTNLKHKSLVISSYNVLAEPGHPSARDRYATLADNILSKDGLADILILQEVCDEFLLFLLAQNDICRRYPFSSHGPPGEGGVPPLPSLQNIVVLSQQRFSWNWIPFEPKHKGAVILEMQDVAHFKGSKLLPLVIAAVHLSAGLTDPAADSKMSQLQSILSILAKEYPDNPSIIAGDFNFTTSQGTIQQYLKQNKISETTANRVIEVDDLLSLARYDDAWAVTRSDAPIVSDLAEGEYGATFNPIFNPLAAASAGQDARPQRYDRILVRQGEFLKIAGFNLFGTPESSTTGTSTRCGSDHWGIRARLLLGRGIIETDMQDSTSVSTSRLPQSIALPDSLGLTDDLLLYLQECGMLPGVDDVEKRENIMKKLTQLLTMPVQHSDGSSVKIPLALVPVGSYGLGSWNPGSDIDCSCVGSISSKTFFNLAAHRIRRATDSGIRIHRKIKAATGTMLELKAGDVHIDLHYCPAANLVDRLHEIPTLPRNDPIFDLPFISLMKIQPFREQELLRRTIPDMSIFSLTLRCIVAWAQASGIYSSKFGLLGGIHITMMLARLYGSLSAEIGRVTAPELLRAFFRYYARFDWENQMLDSPGCPHPYRRSQREPFVITTHYAPVINIGRAVSTPSLRIIREALTQTDRLLDEPGVTWSNALRGATLDNDNTGAEAFLRAHSNYIKVQVQYWAASLTRGNSLVGWLESRFFHLLNDIYHNIPDIHARIWPARFTNGDVGNTDEYQGCYLIGLERRDTTNQSSSSRLERKQLQELLQARLDQFMSRIAKGTDYYDPTVSCIFATLEKQTELGNLQLDNRSWGTIRDGDDDASDVSDESEDEENDEDEDDADNDEARAYLEEQRRAFPSAERKTQNQSQKAGSKPKSGNKLRPAADVISRLRWDPNIDIGDYIIGYEDRFLGVREMALSRWKSEQTHEEFIPQHRVTYFKRKSDGKRVWDRESRIDAVFGSGAGKGE
ncbi:hypothetical protein FQN57_001782 [Myotisia sp. PD_48]|nr:hypothetical protein FQN57_001782 [Myotisia sp. PD_48]